MQQALLLLSFLHVRKKTNKISIVRDRLSNLFNVTQPLTVKAGLKPRWPDTRTHVASFLFSAQQLMAWYVDTIGDFFFFSHKPIGGHDEAFLGHFLDYCNFSLQQRKFFILATNHLYCKNTGLLLNTSLLKIFVKHIEVQYKDLSSNLEVFYNLKSYSFRHQIRHVIMKLVMFSKFLFTMYFCC